MAETVRTFIAIELSPEARDFVARCQERLKAAGGDVRWVQPDKIHLTLVFLGEVPVESLADLERAVRSVAAQAEAMTLQVTGAGRFPPRGTPRTLWIGVAEPTGRLAQFQKALADATAVFAEKAEDRRYEPHLTVGRAKSGKDSLRLSKAVDALGPELGPSFEAREVTIFKSVLGPQGPTYTPLVRAQFGKT